LANANRELLVVGHQDRTVLMSTIASSAFFADVATDF
jgi:hypothetical protein